MRSGPRRCVVFDYRSSVFCLVVAIYFTGSPNKKAYGRGRLITGESVIITVGAEL